MHVCQQDKAMSVEPGPSEIQTLQPSEDRSEPDDELSDELSEERYASLFLVLPLALAGFIIAAACWTLFAVVGVTLRSELRLSELQFGLLLAMPMAVSALLAVPAGLCAGVWGARKVMLWCLVGLTLSMTLVFFADSFAGYIVAAGGLGLAGGFYSAGLRFVTIHCRPQRLGLVLGVFGAGITGAGFNYYLVPLLHEAYSWRGVPLAYVIVLLLILALFLMITEPDDQSAPFAGKAVAWRECCAPGAWHSCVYFSVIAGSFFALALWLPDYLSARSGLPVGPGAYQALWFVLPGALAQIAGGALADRLGSSRVVIWALLAALAALFVLSYPPMTLSIQGVGRSYHVELLLPRVWEGGVMIMLGTALGAAIGALQRMIILESRDSAAVMAGVLLLGAFTVAFVLPIVFAAINAWLNVRSAVFMLLFVMLVACLLLFARNTRRRERRELCLSQSRMV
jgi:NNP family nitrate/nitrite transporter-like MFS transporter